MVDFNKVLLAGRLGRDPEMKTTSSGTKIASLNMAVNEGYGEKKKTIWVDVEAWEKTAEFCANYLKKGSAVFVEGRLKMDEWTDKQSGQKRSKLAVTAERIQFAESKGDGEKTERAETPAPQRQPQAPKPSTGNSEDDLPF